MTSMSIAHFVNKFEDFQANSLQVWENKTFVGLQVDLQCFKSIIQDTRI